MSILQLLSGWEYEIRAGPYQHLVFLNNFKTTKEVENCKSWVARATAYLTHVTFSCEISDGTEKCWMLLIFQLRSVAASWMPAIPWIPVIYNLYVPDPPSQSHFQLFPGRRPILGSRAIYRPGRLPKNNSAHTSLDGPDKIETYWQRQIRDNLP